jgi:hypothetical protein
VVKKRIEINDRPADYSGTVNGSGVPHGRGTWQMLGSDDDTSYCGSFVNGRREGFGKFILSGYMYVGEWKADLPRGYGSVRFVVVSHS